MTKKVLLALAAALALAGVGYWVQKPAPATPEAPVAPAPVAAEPDLRPRLQELVAAQRQIIVLLADEAQLSPAERTAARTVGQALFHDKLARSQALEAELAALAQREQGRGYPNLGRLLDYVESEPALFDADRLAFRELLQGLQQALSRSGTLDAVKLHKRLGEDLEALAAIEQNYEKEYGQIFSRFQSRAIEQKRERWDDYLAALRKLYSREQILKDQGVVLGYSPEKLAQLDKAAAEPPQPGLPPKTLLLTFDDGPHPRYTEEVKAILRQYGVPAVFFAVGRNLGSVAADGKAQLGAQAAVARRLKDEGFTLANHSYSHAQLSKASGAALKGEILNADALLKALDPQRAPLFRFPYGAHSGEGLAILQEAQLQSVMWQIDSLDWADPVPSSIADRVLRQIDQAGRGIVLFHDIHERTVKALPQILDRLVAEGYQFAGWDGQGFSTKTRSAAAPERITTGYRQSWAVVIGIDEYKDWPRLQHAGADADAMRQLLQQRFGFAPERTIVLKNQEATRQGILSAFHERLAHGGLQKDDRVLVFFAGHGATRKLSSGRELGYIVPVDAANTPERLATDAISMSELQNIAESLPAKHLLFVMDSCYSGLGLTRGSAGSGFLRQNALRLGRQMLTAGGADQLVADGGPGGHSVFTWTLLQALGGKGDLNGDGLITGTELAAYVAPAVAGVSQQTPAFGSLPGSQGGEFVFELAAENEFLSPESNQLAPEAIALNSKLDAAQAEAPGPASAPKVADLSGQARPLAPSPTVPLAARQLAQRANDRGLQLYREQRYAEAEAAFTEALKLRPEFALAANNLGYVYLRQNKAREAVRWFENTLKLDPSRAIAYLNLGEAWQALGDAPAARKAFQTYLELAPQGAGAERARAGLKAG
ncbi:MAG: tetratricopeptide repeat protein [Inhella sp.]